MDPAPTIAIVGRPNVGKSTLFNRLIGKRHAVIAHEAGTTRDRVSQKYNCNGYDTLLIDTGGIEIDKKGDIEENIQVQAKIAIEEADIIIFIINLTEELTVDDFTAAEILRKTKKPVILIGNKADNPEIEKNIYNLYELGFDEPIAMSAIHKLGTEELETKLEKTIKKLKFKKKRATKKNEEVIDLCVIGKPNAGKSSLINAILGQEKVIVSDIPGTTRDATDTKFIYEEQEYNLIDTAGLKRRGKIERGIDKFSSLRVFTSIERCDVAVLIIDGEQGITNQDTHIVEHVLETKKGLIIAINKIDLLEKGEEIRNRIIGKLRRRFAFTPWAPAIFISAKNKTNTYKILEIAKEIKETRKTRVKTPQLNGMLQKITQKHLPSGKGLRKARFMYGSQVEINPPKFTLFFKHAKNLHFSYPRYLENKIREEYGLIGTPIILQIKTSVGNEKKPGKSQK